MIRIELDDATLARTRIATSPLWETVAAAFLLVKYPGRAPWPYTSWAERARRTLPPEALRAVSVLTVAGGIPDFLTPPPPSAGPTIGEETAMLRATDPAVVRRQLADFYGDDIPPRLAEFRSDPTSALHGLVAGIRAFWDVAMAPHWPAMRAALEEEILLRARALAAYGPEILLGDLHDRIRWEAPALMLLKPFPFEHSARDRRLTLIPLLFSPGALICAVDDPEMVAVSYQARGAVVLADGPEPRDARQAPESADQAPDRLSALLGRSRATVLRTLVRPATTAALAAHLGLAASTVSEHLAGLHAAGMVYRSRVGRRVLYGLEPAGVALLNLLEPVDLGTGHRARRATSERLAG